MCFLCRLAAGPARLAPSCRTLTRSARSIACLFGLGKDCAYLRTSSVVFALPRCPKTRDRPSVAPCSSGASRLVSMPLFIQVVTYAASSVKRTPSLEPDCAFLKLPLDRGEALYCAASDMSNRLLLFTTLHFQRTSTRWPMGHRHLQLALKPSD